MRTLQASFVRGEISPLLHARCDLALYSTGLARLLNFIVLPHGGVTRRPGFARVGNSFGAARPRLVPFVFNRDDSHVIEFNDRWLRVWQPSTGNIVWSGASPYSASETMELKYAQSGNWLFLVHRNHPVHRLVRRALNDWAIEEFEIEEGSHFSIIGKIISYTLFLINFQ